MKTLGFSPYAYPGSIHPFDKVFTESVSLADAPVEGCSAIILWGGTDICPSFYGQKAIPQTEYSDDQRDTAEWKYIIRAVAEGIPIIGVCRGAQMLCAFAGGSLYQHVTGHHSNHAIATKEGMVYQQVAADHHQMMNIDGLDEETANLLAWSQYRQSTFYQNDKGTFDTTVFSEEPEVVWFPKIRGLAIQPHPEWMSAEHKFNQYVFSLINQFVLKEENHV